MALARGGDVLRWAGLAPCRFAVQAANIRLLIEVEERSKREARLTAELEELRREAERAS